MLVLCYPHSICLCVPSFLTFVLSLVHRVGADVSMPNHPHTHLQKLHWLAQYQHTSIALKHWWLTYKLRACYKKSWNYINRLLENRKVSFVAKNLYWLIKTTLNLMIQINAFLVYKFFVKQQSMCFIEEYIETKKIIQSSWDGIRMLV